MTDDCQAADLLLLAPLAREYRIALPLLGNARVLPFPPRRRCGTFGRRTAVLIQLGIGPEPAGQLAARMIEAHRPGMVILFGLAGGLDPNRSPGTLILADRILRLGPGAETGFASIPLQLPTALLESFQASASVVKGAVVTADRLVGSPTEKHQLFEATGALAVDMESYELAAVCLDYGISFSVLRAICDEARTPLPREFYASIRSDGTLSLWRLLSATLRKPKIITYVPAIHRSAKAANQTLSRALRTIASLQLPIHNS